MLKTKAGFGVGVGLIAAGMLMGGAALAQSVSSSALVVNAAMPAQAPASVEGSYARGALQPVSGKGAWELGVFGAGGFGTSDRSDYHFANAGVRLGKVLTDPIGPGFLKGQFEYLVDVRPFWQAYTPKATVTVPGPTPESAQTIRTGGTFTGYSVTPITLRWNLEPGTRVALFAQGGGGLVYTTHKFPPGDTSVWNFTPQFGLGMHYFVKPKRSVDFIANAVHLSSASLGDKNPGVNAFVEFQLGYTWWK